MRDTTLEACVLAQRRGVARKGRSPSASRATGAKWKRIAPPSRVMRALSSPVFEEKARGEMALSHTGPLIQREVADESATEMEAATEATTEPETLATEEAPASGD